MMLTTKELLAEATEYLESSKHRPRTLVRRLREHLEMLVRAHEDEGDRLYTQGYEDGMAKSTRYTMTTLVMAQLNCTMQEAADRVEAAMKPDSVTAQRVSLTNEDGTYRTLDELRAKAAEIRNPEDLTPQQQKALDHMNFMHELSPTSTTATILDLVENLRQTVREDLKYQRELEESMAGSQDYEEKVAEPPAPTKPDVDGMGHWYRNKEDHW